MASKGSRLKLDHEARPKRQKVLDPREPQRPKAHWDHVLEEMVWLSKDFESERKWKLAQAKKVALKASRGFLDQDKRVKGGEQRIRKVALNISKDVKKFWMKIEKLVLFKHQLELDVKKKKVLDKQLEFLLGQTERYSTMLAENLVNSPAQGTLTDSRSLGDLPRIHDKNSEDDEQRAVPNSEPQSDSHDGDYGMESLNESEDDEHTIDEDEALISKEEREEELAALQDEVDLPLEELLKRYTGKVDGESEQGDVVCVTEAKHSQDGKQNGDVHLLAVDGVISPKTPGRRCVQSNGFLSVSSDHFLVTKVQKLQNPSNKFQEIDDKSISDVFSDEPEDKDFVLSGDEDIDNCVDDETTLSEEEELARVESKDDNDEISLLQKESEIPIDELLARYMKDRKLDKEDQDNELNSVDGSVSDTFTESSSQKDNESNLSKVHSSNGPDTTSTRQHVVSSHEESEAKSMGEVGVEEGESRDIIADAAAAARSAQPTGNTFSTAKVRTKYPFLLKFPLREYQHIGLDWLVTLYDKKLNGILADEMGLGKTIMTIALLAHLACEKGIWGPHLIVVPTSVMLNWETEFLKWCPAFKILTYFGSAKERKTKRQGWLKPHSFHVCVTTYRLVIQDSKVFKRKKWKYLILDEAHLIKNWKSLRWQTLLNFNSKRRILITGTPLQNDLMELWSLMHFLMPHIFQSHQEFKDWFCNPINGMVEGQEKVNKEVIDRLHSVLRPFILRRLKRDVEKQLPLKHEHVINCKLSKRQRNLYEDFIASADTQATLASSNFFGMISVIMQLRKVCNHPDLFEGRPIVSSFDMSGFNMQLSTSVCSILDAGPFSTVNLSDLGILFTHLDLFMTSWEYDEIQGISTPSYLIEDIEEEGEQAIRNKKSQGTNIFEEIQRKLMEERCREAKARAASMAWWNSLKCRRKPVYSTSLRDLVTLKHPVYDIHCPKNNPPSYLFSSKLADVIHTPVSRFQEMLNQVESFMFAIPAARVSAPVCWSSRGGTCVFIEPIYKEKCSKLLSPLLTPFRPAIVRRQVYFPDRRLIQFDCGKLQKLASLLRRLKLEGHRALIFTQMTKMLDILEAFINLYGYTYMRLDGSTLPEERQTLMQRFNTNPKIFLFILSTRSGGVGINLVGADTVIFYDSDWNPAMDQQAQDRCHRIGQTREVHIYRLISESTIEENILKKANQKRALDNLVIQSGGYNTEFFKKLNPMELLSGHQAVVTTQKAQVEEDGNDGSEIPLSNADVEAALKHAEDEADYMALKKVEQEEAVDNQEFTEEAMGKLEDDELVNDDDMKVEEGGDDGGLTLQSNTDCGVVRTSNTDPGGLTAATSARDSGGALDFHDPIEDGSLDLVGKVDDFDMIADVKEMATAASVSGQTVLTFENQLRPIDQYAIRFLELWDPIIDKNAAETQVQFEEKEWELDRIEKLKEDMEADVDDDEEPLLYERWDADFATEVYHQQVEALAQHQLMEELESEAKKKDLAECGNSDSARIRRKPKSKKKAKKTKLKSLKKGGLSSESKTVKKLTQLEFMSSDEDAFSDDVSTNSGAFSDQPVFLKKRKLGPYDYEKRSKKSKKTDKGPETGSLVVDDKLPNKPLNAKYSKNGETASPVDTESKSASKSASKSKTCVKFSITPMPVNRFVTIKHEKKPKKKGGNIWKDHFPLPDTWMPQEDVVLCGSVHEYGPNWELASELLYNATAGGVYRGRYRHPVHCCERFRDLMQRHVLSGNEAVNNDKASNTGSGKALLRVTEDNIKMLLNAVSEQLDHEPLIQRHFFSIISSVWRVSCNASCSRSSSIMSRNSSYSSSQSSINHEPSQKARSTNSIACSKLVAAALDDSDRTRIIDKEAICSNTRKKTDCRSENLDILLEISLEKDDISFGMPSLVRVSIPDPRVPPAPPMHFGLDKHLRSSQDRTENQFRVASRACAEDCLGWGSLAFSAGDIKSRTPAKLQSSGKHKLTVTDSVKSSKSKSRKPVVECSNNANNSVPEQTQTSYISGFEQHDLSTSIPEGGLGCDPPFHLNNELVDGNVDSFDMFPHEYDPGLTSSLDDYLPFPEFTDVG